MYKFFLFIKKVIFCLTLLFIFNILFTKFIYAQNSKNDLNKELDNVINIEIPSENIKNIPIIGYKLIYQEYNASLINFLNAKIINFKKLLSTVGIKEKNIVIIFTNYKGKTLNKEILYDFKKPLMNPEIDAKQFLTDEKICLNLTDILKHYPLPFLTAKRSVLIGTLVNNSNLFRGNNHLKVADFNFPDTKAINLYKSPTDQVNEAENTLKEVCQNKNSDYGTSYTYEEIISNRAHMISYMNLNTFSNIEFIGMMEYQDLVNHGLVFFALPGNLDNFLYPKNN